MDKWISVLYGIRFMGVTLQQLVCVTTLCIPAQKSMVKVSGDVPLLDTEEVTMDKQQYSNDPEGTVPWVETGNKEKRPVHLRKKITRLNERLDALRSELRRLLKDDHHSDCHELFGD